MCEGGVAGLFDMSGNAWEWVNSCGAIPDGTVCELRGGGVSGTVGDAELSSACGASSVILFDAWLPPDMRLPQFGIRCCADSSHAD